MITRLFSVALRGVEALEIEGEVNARGADKSIVIIVGLPDAAVRESSPRVISAIGASALYLDDGVKTVNLASRRPQGGWTWLSMWKSRRKNRTAPASKAMISGPSSASCASQLQRSHRYRRQLKRCPTRSGIGRD